MKHLKFLLLLTLLLSAGVTAFSQEEKMDTSENEQLFTDKDKNFQQLWYYDQVLKMQLNEEGRDDYLALLQYYTFKMTRLALAKYNYTDAEQRTMFDDLVEKMNAEMQDVLSPKNYKIHVESFTTIEEMVYTKKNWKK